MTSKMNRACTLKVGQIEKNPILALGTTEKDIETYERVARAYGNVVPAIVGQSGKAYRILAGQARLEACAQNGIREMPAIIAEISGEAEQMKLALLLSTVRDEASPLSEGAFIHALITQHGVTRRELMALLKKSKAWISRRQSLDVKLCGDVKGMVKEGTVSPRAAEEIAKMPHEAQVAFACRVVMDGLNKAQVGQLAGLYVQEDTSESLREAILSTPLAVLDAAAVGSSARRREKRGQLGRIADSVGFLIRMAGELKSLLATADAHSILMLREDLTAMCATLSDLCTAAVGAIVAVSPGERQGGDAT